MMMDEEDIRLAIEKLDLGIPKDGAIVRFQQYGGGPDESKMEANESGYLRLGVELLKAAYSKKSYKTEGNSIFVDLEYLVSPDSDVDFDWFERNDSLKPFETQEESWKNKIVSMFIAGFMFSFIALAVYGALALLRLM